MRNLLAPVASLFIVTALSLTGCGTTIAPETAPSTSTAVEVDVPETETSNANSFVDGVLTTPDFTIKITDYRVIPAGMEGNEYGDAPVLAIWYDTTNLGTSDDEITPMRFIYHFDSFQDNNPNIENKLKVGMLPDSTFGQTQTASIKAGGTLANAIAYVLTDTTTPVDLVASEFIGDEIGRMTFNLN
ncbi:hypothetical protein CATRI_08360 [Corynebacterium atrinae]|uniref:DUF5067 domain-containing protein n=1 Tax=Corynebacterium atrinae TaxID=1336740 RepID=UPI0025B3D026|nr:DUF5067 domain-containing protein [Corynebacterium atrinae]WJY63744.1 hypothetical protein CATRI_08360 [Corynebacterium atrinae]